MYCSIIFLFQFYLSAIKRLLILFSYARLFLFQFYLSAIKSARYDDAAG
ncbi:MAG: hypothetical protein JWQ14_3002, partial [Adhaeribacter sp.]|nr:hypothetical protein [Adhaeribacter sp.]